jgi:hypothetical protein
MRPKMASCPVDDPPRMLAQAVVKRAGEEAQGWRRLIAAIIRQAAHKARAGDVRAICWLQDQDTLDTFVTSAGIDSRKVKAHAGRWLARELAKRARKFEAQARRSRQWEAGRPC